MNNHLRMQNWELADKRVFVRADLNTDLTPEVFSKSLKFQRLLPTLEYLKKHGARVTLATHLGRPEKNDHDPKYSTRQLIHYFNKHNFSCVFSTVDNLESTLKHAHDIILLENMRFYSEEETDSQSFAESITRGCDYFIEDGFGVLARTETSVTTAAQLFYYKNRSIGFLVEEELKHLQPIKDSYKKPYLIIIGGKKGVEKLKTLYNFFDKATHIALCPGVSELPEIQGFIEAAHKHNIITMLPEDYIIVNDQKVSIGQKTLKSWQPIIKAAHTIIYNGLMGFFEVPETTAVTQQLFEKLAESSAHVILAGGDTTLAAQNWNISGEKLFLSTGGGSTLTYLSGEPLPGLEIIS